MALRFVHFLVLILSMSVLLSCANGNTSLSRDKLNEGLKLPASFEVDGKEQYSGKWWEVFESPELNGLMDKMISGNFQIAGSYERLKALQTALGITEADRLPSVNASAGVSETYSTDTRGEREWREGYDLSLAASYEADIWGRIKAGADSDRYEILSGRYDIESIYMSLTAELADRFFLYKSLAATLKMQRQQLELRQKQLSAIEMMYSSGIGSLDSIYAVQTSMADLMESMTETRQSMTNARRQIALLTGESEADRIKISDSYDMNIPFLPAVIPSEVAEKRPDVMSAYAEVMKVDMDRAQAAANRYPKLSFTASTGYSGDAIENLISPENFVANLVGNLAMPLFDAGRLKRQEQRQEYLLEYQIYSYYQTVLNALNEVSSALSDNVQNEQALKLSSEKVSIEEKRLKIAEMKYEMGIKDYSDVIDNKISLLKGWITEVNARRVLVSSRIELARAAGGSWAGEIVKQRLAENVSQESN